tara:strand:- start:1138 stop:1320 length:183 start_codon:yes stop_codon:yes gene_type:complete
MEMEYTKKDIKKAPKIKKVEKKEGVYKVDGGYGFYDKKNDVVHQFKTEKNAKIAYERHNG